MLFFAILFIYRITCIVITEPWQSVIWKQTNNKLNKVDKKCKYSGIMFPLACLMLLSNLHLTISDLATSSASDLTSLPTYNCINQADDTEDSDQTLRPSWIKFSPGGKNNLGIIQTPNFPKHFPLPLRCVWIFNNTKPSGQQANNFLLIYFTRVSQRCVLKIFHV